MNMFFSKRAGMARSVVAPMPVTVGERTHSHYIKSGCAFMWCTSEDVCIFRETNQSLG